MGDVENAAGTCWRVIGAGVVGTSHAARGVGFEDAFAWRSAGRLTVTAIADGAGSRSPTSAVGSFTAVQAVTGALDERKFLDAFELGGMSAIHWLFLRALRAVEAEALHRQLKPGRLSTTLSIALVDEDHVYIGQIGDGIAVVRQNNKISAVAVGRRGEYVGEADFLTDPGAVPNRLERYEGVDVDAFVLSTDGLQYKILSDTRVGTPFTQFFTDTWDYARGRSASSASIESFLAGVDDQSGDDKTLLVAVRGYEGTPGDAEHTSARPAAHDPAGTSDPMAGGGLPAGQGRQ